MWQQLHQLRQTYLDLNLQNALNYEKFCMISIVYHSSKIEGCSLTETETKTLINKALTANGKPLQDHLMVRDHYEAFLFIKEKAQQKQPLSLPFIQQMGAYVMKHTGGIVRTALGDFDISKGDLRLTQVYVDKKYFPNYKKVPTLLQQFCQAINSRLKEVQTAHEILQLAADAHYNFVNIHPFADGNGRTARLLTNYIQLFYNEPLVKVFTEDRNAYIHALNETESQGDAMIFRSFIAQQQIKFYQAEIAKFKQKDKGFTFLF